MPPWYHYYLRRAPYDSESVRTLFNDMAATYGRVHLISSFGFAARWRRQTVEGLPLESAGCVIDLMSGMGELCRSLAPRLTRATRVIGVDLSPEMARRARQDWPFSVDTVVTDVLAWDNPVEGADIVVSSFGLKTFDKTQLEGLSRAVARILKQGGAYSFVEISVPPFAPLRLAFLFYLRWVIPAIGWLLLGNPDCYRMLWAYTTNFGNTSHFVQCLRGAGLTAAPVSYFWGCATGARGIKPLHLGPLS